MKHSSMMPNECIAASVVASMTNEKVLSTTRMTTGDQYFVFAVMTTNSEYVIRMTHAKSRMKFVAAIYWQKKLIPLGITLAKFIKSDLEGEHSQFPALLMLRLPGDDICFGDPLFVLALTYVALELDGHDVLYADYWTEALQLDLQAKRRLALYRFFYSIMFMRKHAMKTSNDKQVFFDVQRLKGIFQQSLVRIKAFGI